MPEFSASLAFMHQYTGHHPSHQVELRAARPTFDKSETDEWVESLNAVVSHHGKTRTRFLLHELMEEANRLGVAIPPPVVHREWRDCYCSGRATWSPPWSTPSLPSRSPSTQVTVRSSTKSRTSSGGTPRSWSPTRIAVVAVLVGTSAPSRPSATSLKLA
mmetsp:Transcript_50947/g.163496  ORF Transcript_50947/g.163496 Transcript_50947/m.163496 type:complete len:160 (+) Transcript_50947:267-746(+)